jgi:alkanesulfonate monooxygenase SsuD/methylene tetrahydromethanopterin reductase-like flavin-dependent oxidoreductase (luciferase family)
VEELGYDHLILYDHVVGAVHENRNPPLWEHGPYTDKDPFHDPLVVFGYLAGITQRLEFMTGILILPQRQTVLVAKQAADVDLLPAGGCGSVLVRAGTMSSTMPWDKASRRAAPG